MYHDLIEIHAGDTFVLDEEKLKTKKEREDAAHELLCKELPEELVKEYDECWQEYEEKKTREAIFAHAVDSLDPIMQAFNQPDAWRKYGFTEQMVRDKKEPYIKEFPEMMEFFNELLANLRNRDIIPE